MRLVEQALYGMIAAAFVDSGCNADYARLVVEFGLQRSRTACQRVLFFIA